MSRKRKRTATASNRPTKKPKSAHREPCSSVHHSVLSSFYPRVCTMRDYLLGCLPAASRIRRRKLTIFGNDDSSSILDTCLVGVLKQPPSSIQESRRHDFATFTQTQARATGANSGRPQLCSINEVGYFLELFDASNGALTDLRLSTLSSGPCSNLSRARQVRLITFCVMDFNEAHFMEMTAVQHLLFSPASSASIPMTV
jgi:hypothetical protein